MGGIRNWWIKLLPWITGAWVITEMLSLRLGILNPFFYDSSHANVQGIDYFSIPKAFLNLAAGDSAFATFDPPAYGPHFTWFINHPAVAVWLGSWLSLFPPMTSYGVYTLFSMGLMASCAWLMARESRDPLKRRVVWLLMLGAFPTYWLLFVGNVHAVVVLAIGMLFTGLYRLANHNRGQGLILAGLLISLLSKPVVLLIMPLLLLLKETRKEALRALGIYAVVSFLFEVVPALNPQAIGLKKVAWLALHPAFVRTNMNSYTNHFAVNYWMRDNSVHWFNMIAQSGARMVHIDIFSLPVFLDTLTGKHTPNWLYRIPLLLVWVLAIFVARISDRRLRLEGALLLSMATSLVFFLGYPTAWEYQYTSVLPIAAILLIAGERGVFYSRERWWMFGLAACIALPSFYVFVDRWPITSRTLLIIWADRVLPVTVLYFLMMGVLVRFIVFSQRQSRGRSSGKLINS